MKALPGSVVDFTEIAAQRAADKALHPALRHQLLNAGLPTIDKAHALTVLAREWSNLVDELAAGPDNLGDDVAEQVMQVLAAGLVHPLARPSLVFQLTQLRQAVCTHDSVRDGDLHWSDLDCRSQPEALEQAAGEVDGLLWPLLSGLPLRDACRGCRSTAASVNYWRTQTGCDLHRERTL